MSSVTRRAQITYGRRSRPKPSIYKDQEEFQIASAQGKPNSLVTPGKSAPRNKQEEMTPPDDLDEIIEELLESDGHRVTTTRGGSKTFSLQIPKFNQYRREVNSKLPIEPQRQQDRVTPTTKLKEKPNSTRIGARASILQTPVSNPPAEPKFDYRQHAFQKSSSTANASGVTIHTSPLAHRSILRKPVRSEPALEDQDFLNILPPGAKVLSSHRRFGFSNGTSGKALDTKNSNPFHEPPTTSGIQAHISATRAAKPGFKLLQKAKKVVNSTKANIFGHNRPIIFAEKGQKPRESETPRSWGRLRKGSASYGQICENVESDLNDELKTPQQSSRKYGNTMLHSGESKQNLLERSPSEGSSRVEGCNGLTRPTHGSYGIYDRMTDDFDIIEDPDATSTPMKMSKNKKKRKITTKPLPDVEDFDFAFDGDVEMFTEDEEAMSEDDGGALISEDEFDDAKDRVEYDWSVFETSDPFEDGVPAIDDTPKLMERVNIKTVPEKKKSSIPVYRDTMEVDTVTRKRSYEEVAHEASSRTPNPKRRPLGAKQKNIDVQQVNIRNKQARVSMQLERPLIDESMLSEDELASNKYVLAGLKSGLELERPKARPMNKKQAGRGESKQRYSRVDMMDVDES